jgi:aarF domain-containing kinase
MLDILNSGQEGEDHKMHSGGPKYGITLVDAGMVAQLTDEESSTFIGLLTTLGEGDGRAAAEFTLRFSIENHMDKEESEAFVSEMSELFAEKCRGYGTNVDAGEVLRGILRLINAHHVRIDANFATLVINILCVESLARRVCPTYNVLDASRPLLQTYRKLCFQKDGITPRSKEGYHKVSAILMNTGQLQYVI